MRILQICFVYPPSFSGYGRQLQTINREILQQDENIRIDVITCFDKEYHKANSESRVNVKSLFKENRSHYKYEPFIFYFFCLAIPVLYLYQFLKSDLIHVVKAGPEAFATILFCKAFGKKVIVKVAQDEMETKKITGLSKYLRMLRLNTVKYADRIVSISPKIKDDLLKLGANEDRIVSIPNAVDCNKFQTVNQENKLKLRENLFKDSSQLHAFHFLFLGSMTKRKGVLDILNALKYLRNDKNVVIKFIGPIYNDIKDFESIVENKNSAYANITIKYMSFVDDPQFYLQASDCMLLPSYSEGLPNVVLESLSCGVPVIVSDIPNHKDLVSTDVGELFSLGNPKDLADKMNLFIDKGTGLNEKSNNARSLILESYSSKKVAKSYYSEYSKLVNIN